MAMERMVIQPLILARGNVHVRGVATCLRPYNSTAIRQRTLIRNPTGHSISTLQGTRVGDGKSTRRIPVVQSHNHVRALPLLCNRRGPARLEAVCRYSTAASLKQDLSSDPRYQPPNQGQRQQQSHPPPPPLPSTPTTPTVSTTSFRTLDFDNANVSQASVELSTEQRFLLEQVIDKKKSVFFTGSAGTGKSVLLRQLIEELKGHYKLGQVAVTASTGIAACNIGGCTLHSFAGVGLGIGTAEQLMAKLDDNKRAKTRWRKLKVLIIDESDFDG
ncbi:PIF1-like helicase-domain-containing protein [Dissophora ornata]|nr:PIF1-like helicase-domain-containing protein [Dissophora ornata]